MANEKAHFNFLAQLVLSDELPLEHSMNFMLHDLLNEFVWNMIEGQMSLESEN